MQRHHQRLFDCAPATPRRARAFVVDSIKRLEIRVADQAPGCPVLRRASRTDASGRALALVAALASEWGLTDAAWGGNEVWANLVRRPQPT
ncbi:MAG: hypothetical protein QOG01_3406 [Pseudonocardiales bacterium]|jgi:hypothetical protein|nr:hypothetical protein [Pseudonocardiales bacterium]